MNRVESLSKVMSSLEEGVELCFDLCDDILSDKEVAQPIDKAVVLMETAEELRKVYTRLNLLRYRIEKEEEDGITREDEG